MKRFIFKIALMLMPVAVATGQESYKDTSRLKLIFAGDIMGHDSQIASALEDGKYNYDTCFSLLKPYIESADVAVANLEVTLAGPPYKGYPQFSSPDDLAEAAKKAGFDVLITANNHSLDRRFKGVARTDSVLSAKGIIHTGTFSSKKSRKQNYPLLIEKNSIRLALLNYTYGTNGITVREPYAVNYIDTALIRKDIQKARTAAPDFVIVTIHWGLEYQRDENTQQQNLANAILEMGADAIIGSHPHVVQPVKKYFTNSSDSKDYKVVVYSLGNFISNQRQRYRNGGIMYEMTLEKTDKVRIQKQSFLPVWVYKPLTENNKRLFMLVPASDSNEYRQQINMPDQDFSLMKTFYEDTRKHLDIPLSPRLPEKEMMP